MTTRTIAVVSAGLSQPSSTGMLADRLAGATRTALEDLGADVDVVSIDLRQHAHDLTDNLLTFFDVLDEGALRGKPVLLGATGGTARHSLAIDHAMRPLFAYLGALVNPTALFAATEDWGGGEAVDSGLVSRIERAGSEFAALIDGRPMSIATAGLSAPTSFVELLEGS